MAKEEGNRERLHCLVSLPALCTAKRSETLLVCAACARQASLVLAKLKVSSYVFRRSKYMPSRSTYKTIGLSNLSSGRREARIKLLTVQRRNVVYNVYGPSLVTWGLDTEWKGDGSQNLPPNPNSQNLLRFFFENRPSELLKPANVCEFPKPSSTDSETSCPVLLTLNHPL